jgi:hypothetical protein
MLPAVRRLAGVPVVDASSLGVRIGLASLAAAPIRDSIEQQQTYHNNFFTIFIPESKQF